MKPGRLFLLLAVVLFAIALVLQLLGGYRDTAESFLLAGLTSFAAGHVL